jgi:Proteobacterial transcriptional regulator-like domain
MPDWKNPEDFVYTMHLSRDQWAWEFLRRNPDYRSDYAEFIAVWRELERDYGSPPDRDFNRWKADPRAYRTETEPSGPEGCLVEENRVLIECWMGAKWGFHKFPLDPKIVAPVPEKLSWRKVNPGVQIVAEAHRDYLGESQTRIALGFDLELPLPAQLDAAKFHLVSVQTRMRKSGCAVPRSVAASQATWMLSLRLLDAEETGASADEIGRCLGQNWEADIQAARDLRDGGYRRILLLPDK